MTPKVILLLSGDDIKSKVKGLCSTVNISALSQILRKVMRRHEEMQLRLAMLQINQSEKLSQKNIQKVLQV